MNTPSRIYVSVDLDAVSYNLESMKRNIHKDTKIAERKRTVMDTERFPLRSI